MCSFNYSSDWSDCNELVDFLLGKGNDDLMISHHEVGPFTSARYKGNYFYLEYCSDSFARVISNRLDTDALYEFGNLVGGMIGNPVVYYEAEVIKDGVTKVYPTLEWCLDKKDIDNRLHKIVNNEIFDNNTRCLNVRLFDGYNLEDYIKAPQLVLKK